MLTRSFGQREPHLARYIHHTPEECKRRAKTALTADAIKDYLDMEQRWLNLARSYEFAERLSAFTKPLRGRNDPQP